MHVVLVGFCLLVFVLSTEIMSIEQLSENDKQYDLEQMSFSGGIPNKNKHMLHILRKTQNNNTCTGKWIEHDHVPLLNQHIVHINKSFGAFESSDKVLNGICLAETLYHNCLYHGMTSRTNNVLRRSWHANEEDCHTYHPLVFLDKLRNQQFYLIGDSTMIQTWKYLTCSLLSVTTSNESNIMWLQYQGDKNIYNNKSCPFGANHCLIHGYGHIYFHEYNLNVSYIVNYSPLELQRLIKVFAISANSLVILNYGLHFNSQMQFVNTTKQFLENYHDVTKTPVKPKLFFQESMPQHFTRTTAENGYYNKSEASTYCVPINNMTGKSTLIHLFFCLFLLRFYMIFFACSWASN
jgi:hypothetical protein